MAEEATRKCFEPFEFGVAQRASVSISGYADTK